MVVMVIWCYNVLGILDVWFKQVVSFSLVSIGSRLYLDDDYRELPRLTILMVLGISITNSMLFRQLII